MVAELLRLQGALTSCPYNTVHLQAIVDVVASSGWLHPALAAMEMCQMVVQGQWEKDSPLLQLPHITPQIAAAAAAKDIGTVFDLIEMDEEERRELLQVGICSLVPSCADELSDCCTAVCRPLWVTRRMACCIGYT